MGRHEEALKILHGGTVIPAIPLVLEGRDLIAAASTGWFWTKTGNSTRRASAR